MVDQVVKDLLQLKGAGEVAMVLNDLAGLIGSQDWPQDPKVLDVIRDYIEEHNHIFTLPDKTVVQARKEGRCKAADAIDFVYYDKVSKIQFEVDVFEMTASLAKDTTVPLPEQPQLSPESLKLQSEFKPEVDQYVALRFKESTARADIFSNQENTVNIEITCINQSIKQWVTMFWIGEWQSKWQVDLSSKKLTGTITFNAHYSEHGDFQSKLQQSFDEKIDQVDAKSVCAKIADLENEFQYSSEDTHDQIKASSFKRVRRVLPVTGSKFDWECIQLIN